MAIQARERQSTAARFGAVSNAPVPSGVRFAAAIAFVGLVAVYLLIGGSWWSGLLLLLAPDISMAAFLAGPRVGAGAYNAVHRPLVPTLLLTVVWLAHLHVLTFVLVAWVAHIAMDRAANYGLKEIQG